MSDLDLPQIGLGCGFAVSLQRWEAPVLPDSVSILIVEDDPVLAEALAMLLRLIGFKVCGIAERSTEVLQLNRIRRPDLILMDVHLAGGDCGIDTARRLRDEQAAPVIFLTSDSDPETRRQMEAVDPAAILSKPSDEAQLEAAIRRTLSLPVGTIGLVNAAPRYLAALLILYGGHFLMSASDFL